MSKKNTLLLIILSLFIIGILLQMAFSTTFRVEGTGDRATLIRVTESESSSSSGSTSGSQDSGGTHPSPFLNPPIVDAEGNCVNCLCSYCHERKVRTKSAAQTVDDHLGKYWPRKEYQLKEGEKIQVLTKNAYVAKERGRLVAYDSGKRILLPSKAKVIKAGRKFFILE